MNYNVTTLLCPATPRSKRLRSGANVLTGSTVGTTSSHEHSNKVVLDSLTEVDSDGYLFLKYQTDAGSVLGKVKSGYSDDSAKWGGWAFGDFFERVNVGTEDVPIYALRVKIGLFSDSFVSSKGVSNDVGTGNGAGVNLSAVWESLCGNTDTFGTNKIHIDHIPTLSAAIISDFESSVQELIPKKVSAFTNDANYLTGITSAMVTSALGYTPYSSTNFTKSNIKSTLGIYDWALASTKPSYAFSEITGKPTTLSGYGVTDAIPYKETRVEIKTSAVGYGYQEAGFPAAGGFITAVHHGGNYGFALYGTNNNEGLFYRGLLGGVWNDTWKKIAFTDGHVKSASGVYINNSTASDIFPLVFVNTGSCGNPRIDSLYVDAVKGAGYNPSTKSFHANTFVGYLNGTANNADMLDGVHLADVYRKSGWYRVVPYINNGGIVYHYWFKVAQINYTTTSGLAELELAAVSDANYMYSASARLTIKGYSGNPSCSVSLTSNAYLSTRINVALDKDGGVWVKSNCSWSSYLRWRAIVNDEGYTGITILDGSTKQLDQPINSCVIEENTGATYRQSKDAFETAWAAFDVGIGSFKSYSAQIKILPYNDSAYIEFGNADFTNNVPAFITGYSSNPLNLLTISSHSTIFTGSVTIGGANGVTLSFDATNDMLKFSKGGYFLGAVSTKGVSNDTSGGTGGIDLSAMWNSLSNNTDTFGSIKIHIDHIPTITKSKIRDFPTLVSAFANDAGYITTSAIVNKADKATTLAGYGITDAVTLNTNQTITGLKTFKNAEYYTAIINSTLEDGEVRLILQNNNIPKVLIGYDSLGSFFYDYGSAQTLRIQNDGHLIYTSFIDAQNDISTTGWFVNKQLNKGLYNEAGQQRWYYRSDENQKGWYSTTDIIAANQLVSVLGTGTAPLKVYSTTMVSNLNANYLGGLNKDNFQKAIYDYINTSGVANTTDLPTILAPSNYNGVNSLGGNFKFYDTKFFSSQANTSNRCQLAYGYDVDSIHFRRYNDGNWGGWKEIAFIDSLVEKASGLKVDNNRDVNELPYSYGTEQVNWRFKVNSAIGLTGAGGSYSGVLHLTPWGGKTGGPDHQLAFGYNGGIFHRYGLTNWGDWRKLAFTEGTDNLKVTNASARFTANNGTTSLFYGFGNGSVNRGIWDNSINNWILGTDGANIFMLGANVGVNTTTPAYNFDVNGTTRTNYLRVGNDVTINGDANISSMIMTRNDSGVLSLDGNYIDVYAPMNVHTRLKVGEATISWDSVNGMLMVDKGAYFLGPVSSKGVSNETYGAMPVAQFGIEWQDSWTVDSNEVSTFGNVSNASIEQYQSITNGSIINIVCDAFSGKKVSNIEIFTLGWEGETPADVRLMPYKIVGNKLSCVLRLNGSMTPILFKIKIY